MKMKNYLTYEYIGDTNADSLVLNVSVSHREILRIAARLDADLSPFRVVNSIVDSDGCETWTTDLHDSRFPDSRFFRIVKK